MLEYHFERHKTEILRNCALMLHSPKFTLHISFFLPKIFFFHSGLCLYSMLLISNLNSRINTCKRAVGIVLGHDFQETSC